MRRPSFSLFSLHTPRKRRHSSPNLHSPPRKKQCLWDSPSGERDSKGLWTLRHRLQHKLTKHSPRTPQRSGSPTLVVHSAKKVRELRRPQARLFNRSRSQSLNRNPSSRSRKRKLNWLLDVSPPGCTNKYELRRPRACLARTLVKTWRRSRSLSLSSNRSSSARCKSHDPGTASTTPVLKRKRTRLNSMFTPASRTRKSRRKLLLTRSPSKTRRQRMKTKLQVLNLTKVDDVADSENADYILLQDLQSCIQGLVLQLARVSVKMEALNEESVYYRNVLTDIQNIVSFAENRDLFSDFPTIQ